MQVASGKAMTMPAPYVFLGLLTAAIRAVCQFNNIQ